MKTGKRVCALLLALTLVLSIAMQPGIVGVWAKEDPEDGPDTQIEELLALAEESGEEETNEEESGEGYPWDALETDQALVDWLTLADNADVIKGILNGEQDETRDALDQRITEVLTGTDTELAEMVTAYLTELLTESPDTLARLGITPEETPSEEPENASVWGSMTDEEFSVWVTDEKNAQSVEEILSNPEDPCYQSLYAQINKILDGENQELAEKVNLYLSSLLGPTPDDAMALADEEYIYFDLAAGDIRFDGVNYSGKIFKTDNGTTIEKEIKGTHASGKRYYIYQSTSANKQTTGLVNGVMVLPQYDPVTVGEQSWSSYITNNTDEVSVYNNWPVTIAKKGDRTSTPNTIRMTGSESQDMYIVFDNLWSSFVNTKNAGQPTHYPVAIGLKQDNNVTLALKGDNRFACLWSVRDENTTAGKLIITDLDSNAPGSLTLTCQENQVDNNPSILGGDDKYKYVITNGNEASKQRDSSGKNKIFGSLSLDIAGGVVFAGTPVVNNSNWKSAKVVHCIGSRNESDVTISGGTVTAVSHSTAAAIGCGGGFKFAGGKGRVTITDGTVYAYNTSVLKDGLFVPCTAIGGSSSANAKADTVSVNISGGTIYAESIGGAAIGGGGSAMLSGGDATITISGGNITAWSKPGNVAGSSVPAGISIGGGVGGTNSGQNGGFSKLIITGGTIISGSIGGGSTRSSNGNTGYADVNISGNPNIQAQFVMAKGSTSFCKFTMSGGTIHGVDAAYTNYVYKDGGALWMDDPKGVVTISGGTIQNCTAQLGGAVYMTAGTFNMSGGSIQDCSAVRGGAVYMTAGTFKMSGGTISGNTATENGGGIDLRGGTVNLSGGTLSGNTAHKGGGAYMEKGTLTVSGSANITGNQAIRPADSTDVANGNGGGIDLHGGTVNLQGGTLSNNKADHYGGGVYIATGALHMSGGTVSGNTAQGNGGGIDIHGTENTEADGIVTISGGEIKGNSANQNGGGVFVYDGKLTMTGGTISANTATGDGGIDDAGNATGNGGGIDLHAGEVAIQGGTIENNNAHKNGGGVFVFGGTFTLDQIGATGAIISGNRAIGKQNVQHSGDNTGCGGGIDVHDGKAFIKGGTVTSNEAAHNGGGVFIAEGILEMSGGTVSGNTAQGNGGGIDIHGKENSPDDGIVTISGGTIERNKANRNGGGVFVYEGKLTVTGGTISANTAAGPAQDEAGHATGNGGGIDLHAGTVTISGGTVRKNTAQKNGGGVFVYGGTFTMSGTANISENHANGTVNVLNAGDNTGCGGGIDVHQGSAIIEGGTVTSNEAAHNGGGVFIAEGTLTMNDGSVSGNIANGNGGGIDIHGKDISVGENADSAEGKNAQEGQVVINGGTVDGNTAKKNGGGVFVYGGSFQMTRGHISENTAVGEGFDEEGKSTGNGGGIDLHAGDVTISGGFVENNIANKNGGGVFVYGGTFTINQPAIISGNKAVGSVTVVHQGDNSGFGGGIDVHSGTVHINGGFIEENTANLSGGGLYVEQGEVYMIDGSIYQNQALGVKDAVNDEQVTEKTGSGGGIDIHGGSVEMIGGLVQSNTAKLNGGGVYVYKGNFSLSGDGSIIGNTASANGGGIDVHKGNVTISGGTVERNEADENGGGVYVAEGKLTVTIGTITKNKAKRNGGGLDVHGSDDHNNTSQGIVEISGGEVTENTAEINGGGVFVWHGQFTLSGSGEISRNTALENGGGIDVHEGNVFVFDGTVETNHAKNGAGIYLSKGDLMLCGEAIRILRNEASKNGGGMYIHDGSITMYSGSINYNTADLDGGGMYVNPQENQVNVHLFSGSVSHNTAHGNGGGIALDSTCDKNVAVVVGVNAEHPNLDLTNRTFTPFEYPSSVIHRSDHDNHSHKSCPVIEGNISNGKGGGFYLSGNQTTLTFYCVHEKDNIAQDEQCYGMYMNGGQVNFGASENKTNVNILVESTILVEGGSMDVYGIMTNPRFTEKVTVNVQNQGDHYYDHRTYETGSKHYKVHYYENFTGEGGVPTGLYIAKQYPDPDKEGTSEQYAVDILPFMFTHPGYKIIGWCTNQTPASKDPSKPSSGDTWYQVYQTYWLDQLNESQGMGATKYPEKEIPDPNLLVIYAIWERCGYVLKFMPNVPDGSPYSGAMEDQRVTVGLLDGSQKLSANAYHRNGYVFAGWSLKPDGSDTVYEDQYAIVENFTTEDGAIIPLYAKWELCTHTDHLAYTKDGNVLTQTCTQCGNHTAKMTLTAVDAPYDGNAHLAYAVYEPQWLGEKPDITYTMEASDWDDKDTADDEWQKNPTPIHAGTYTASVTVSSVTATTTYKITRVKWPTPATPKIELKADGDQSVKVVITAPTGEHLLFAKMKTGEVPPPDSGNWSNATEFSGLTYNNYYYFFAVKEDTRDFERSEVSSTEAYLYTGGNMVIIESDVGISATPTTETGSGGYRLTVTPQDGYHYYKYTATLTAEHLTNSEGTTVTGANGKERVKLVEETDSQSGAKNYHVDGLDQANHCVVTIHLTGAAKNASVSAKAVQGQVFRDFNGETVTISRDSAFTASFTVENLIPDEYASQKLVFDHEIPANSTVILKTNGSYWHYRAAAETSSIDLTDFTTMGGSTSFAYPTAMKEDHSDPTEPITYTYQFIVDFSQTDPRVTENKLDMCLKLTRKTETQAPDCSQSVEIGLENVAGFAMTASTQDNAPVLTCSYTPSTGAASIWNGRRMALVLTPEQNATVPSDLTLTAVVGEQTTVHSLNNDQQFIVPLSALSSYDKISLSLHSASFQKEQANMSFTAEWVVSPSGSAEAPMQKHVVASQNLSFNCTVDQVPSVRIDGTQRICSAGDILRVEVTSLGIPAGGTLTASLQSKQQDGSYSDTGVWQNVAINGAHVDIKVGAMPTGSYRILVTASHNGGYLLQVPYYFLIAAS